MKRALEFLLVCFLKTVLWFRYRITVKGLEKLNTETLNKSGGVLFLPNHPTVFVEPIAITIALWPKYPLRPLIVEYMYQAPVVNLFARLLDALPIPNFASSSNSLKRKKGELATQAVMDGLRRKQNFVIFPAGRTKQTAKEAIDGASAVHRIVQETPEANVVLVRVKGLWGSSFSRALIGRSPHLFPTILQGIKHALKNLLFFTPRREVIIEFEPAPADFPYQAGRLEFNKYLEGWYNSPDGLRQQTESNPGDSLILVSYSMWREEIPQIWDTQPLHEGVTLETIPKDIQDKIIGEISRLTGCEPKTLTPTVSLTADLGMDSLDLAELVAFLQDQFDISNINAEDLTSVGRLMAIAAKQVVSEETKEEDTWDESSWKQPTNKYRLTMAPGTTMPEVFLNNCQRMNNAVACGDMPTGAVTYSQLKLRTLVLAEYIRHLPGDYIGILLPASVAASMTILACQLAGKVPMMVNWTVGPRHLQAVAQLSQVKVVLSSWSFLDRLQNVDLTGIEDQLVMLEDVRRKIGLRDKIKGFLRSKFSTKSILKALDANELTPNHQAVLLFTSGTEGTPKGVPLSHRNILSNQKAILETIEVFSDDVIYGILPPFHSFGFTITSLIGVLAGAKIAYSPDPTDGRRLAQGLERWGVTIVCAPPTFIKGMLKAARSKQLTSLRLCISGAEKLPPDLEQMIEQFGKGDTLLEGYGITECSPVLTHTSAGKNRHGVGHPLHGVELCIVDLNTHQPMAQGQQGLILARGLNVFSGYLNPGLASPFLTINNKQWYVTGDLGHLDEQGNLILSGRLKRFIKVGGEMVSLAAIEEALTQGAIKNGWAQDNEEGPILAITSKEIAGEKPKIFLYSKFIVNVDDANKALKDAGFSNLVKITSATQIPEIPLMGSGKVNYRKIEEGIL